MVRMPCDNGVRVMYLKAKIIGTPEARKSRKGFLPGVL
jgi:hypothetical protein